MSGPIVFEVRVDALTVAITERLGAGRLRRVMLHGGKRLHLTSTDPIALALVERVNAAIAEKLGKEVL